MSVLPFAKHKVAPLAKYTVAHSNFCPYALQRYRDLMSNTMEALHPTIGDGDRDPVPIDADESDAWKHEMLAGLLCFIGKFEGYLSPSYIHEKLQRERTYVPMADSILMHFGELWEDLAVSGHLRLKKKRKRETKASLFGDPSTVKKGMGKMSRKKQRGLR